MGIIIEFEIEESVLADIDEVADSIGISRETYIRVAISHALRAHRPKPFSAEDEANTFRLWLAGDDLVGLDAPDWPSEDDHSN